MSIRMCRSEDVEECGSAFAFRVIKDGRTWPAFIIRFKGNALGYLNVCPHAAYRLDAGTGNFFSKDRRRLICTSHGAIFDPEGNRVELYYRTGFPVPQPHGDLIDLDRTDDELISDARELLLTKK